MVKYEEYMGKKGSDKKSQSIRFPKWIADAIEEIAKKRGHTFTDVVIELLRQELAFMGYTMGIGQEGLYDKNRHNPEPVHAAKTINLSRYTHNDMPADNAKFIGLEMVILPYVGKTAAEKPIDTGAFTGEGMPFPLSKLKGKSEDYFIVKIEDTSMTEADIRDGDYTVIQKTGEAVNGKIMLVKYKNSSTLKRIKIKNTKDGKRVFLCREDGSGKSEIMNSSDEYEIQGEFYWNIGQIK